MICTACATLFTCVLRPSGQRRPAVAAAERVYKEAASRMAEWRPEWRRMPERVFGSTMAWLRMHAQPPPSAGGGGEDSCNSTGPAAAAADGGWWEEQSVEAAELAAAAAGAGCSIDRVDASELTIEAFLVRDQRLTIYSRMFRH